MLGLALGNLCGSVGDRPQRWARVSDPDQGLTAGLLKPGSIQLGVAVAYRPAGGAGAFGWAVNEEGPQLNKRRIKLEQIGTVNRQFQPRIEPFVLDTGVT